MTRESSSDLTQSRAYESPAAGLQALQSDYKYWTGRITDLSFQSCLGLIAANWALHSDHGALMANKFAVASVLLALLALLASLVGSFLIARATYEEFYFGTENPEEWRSRWEAAERIPSEWPYTHKITSLGRNLTLVKVWTPVASGVLFVLGAF